MHPRTIRISEKTAKAVESASQQRGFASPSAFIRYAIDQELGGRQDDLTGAEERLARQH
jgi:Arc/MetJ-type ribon-helix-helix transcriptional regulator